MKNFHLPLALSAVLAIAGGIFLLPTTEVDALLGCFPEQTTPIVTGTSPFDEEWAEMDARAQANALVFCSDGTCSQWFEVTESFKDFTTNLHVVKGRTHYECRCPRM